MKVKPSSIFGPTRITFSVVAFCAFIVFIGFFGIYEINRVTDSTEKVYSNRVLPIEKLTNTRYLYLVGIIKISHQENLAFSPDTIFKSKIDTKFNELISNWNAFKSKHKTAYEQKLIAANDILINSTKKQISELKLAHTQQHLLLYRDILKNQLTPTVDQIIVHLNKLIKFQALEIKQFDTLKNDTILSIKWKLYSAISFALVFSLLLIFNVFFNTKSLIKQVEDKDFRIQTFIENSDDSIFLISEAREIMDANHSATELFEMNREELIGSKISEIIKPEFIEDQNNFIEEVLKNKIGITEQYRKTKKGKEIYIEIKLQVIENIGFISIIKDITAKKNAEKAIKESEEKYKYLFSKSPAYIIIWDIETLEVLEVNDAVLTKYGYTKKEWEKLTLLDIRSEEYHSKIKQFALHMQTLEEDMETNIWEHITKDGKRLLMEISSHKFLYNGKNSILSLGRDVTEQRKAETALKESKEQLSLFIEHSPAPMAMLDKELNYLFTSKRWISDYNLFGKDIIGKNHFDILPELEKRWKPIIFRCLLMGAVEKDDEDYFFRLDGSKVWFRWEIRPWHFATGQIGGVIIFTEVLTEQMKAKELSQYFFENAPDIILIVNKFHKIETINRTIEGGLPVEQLIGQDCVDILPEVNHVKVRRLLEACFETGDDQDMETDMGHGIWHKSRFVAMISDERVTHVMIFSSDITAEKKAKEEINKNMIRLQALTENISDAILLLDKNAAITYCSPLVEKISGFSSEEVKRDSIENFIHPEDVAFSDALFLKALQNPGISFPLQFRILHKNGSTIWVEGTVNNLLNDANIECLIINYRDISNRISSEEDLKRSLKIITDYRNALDVASIVAITDLQGNITHVNENFCKISQYTPEELIGQNHRIINSGYHPTSFFVDLWKTITKGNIWKNEVRNRRKDGSYYWVDTTIIPFLDEKGKPFQFISIRSDITDRKIAEQERQEIYEKTMAILEDKVSERTQELHALNITLESHNHAISDSINYAQGIQTAVLPKTEDLIAIFPESFILWKPKDVVSGDFYWGYENEDFKFIAAVDCTGHGVPGAFMSIIANQILNRVIINNQQFEPCTILSELDYEIVNSLNQKNNEVKDGMDIALCRFDKQKRTATFAGAQRPLFYFDGEKINEIPGTNYGIGGFNVEGESKIFTQTTIQNTASTIYYFTSDGYYSQFGGANGKKMLKRRFVEILEKVSSHPMETQQQLLNVFFKEWQGNEEQVDDVIVIGIRCTQEAPHVQ